MSNEITAYFKGRAGVSESLYQYDYGMVLNFDGIELPSSFECYFDTTGSDEAIPAIGTDGRVAIPNDCLSRPGDVTLHIPLHSGVNDSQVEYVVKFRVIGRARPVDGGTPEQQTAIEQALALLQNPITNIEQIVNEALDFTGDTFDEMQAKLDADQAEFEDEMQANQTEFESEINSDFEQLNSQFNNLATNVKANSVTTLWTGTLKAKNDSATLSESVANFDYIDIYTGSTDNRCVRKKVSDLSSVVKIQGQNLYDMSGAYGLAESEIHLSISGTTATIVKTINFSWNGEADQAADSSADSYDVECPIIRIDGVKIGSHESAELTDVRVGDDGIAYSTAGAAVRKQFSDVKSTADASLSSSLRNALDGVSFVKGSINSGAEVVSSTRIRSGYIDISKVKYLKVSAKTGYKYVIYFYKDIDNYVGYSAGGFFVEYETWHTDALYIPIVPTIKYMRVLIADTSDSSSISISDKDKVSVLSDYYLYENQLKAKDADMLFHKWLSNEEHPITHEAWANGIPEGGTAREDKKIVYGTTRIWSGVIDIPSFDEVIHLKTTSAYKLAYYIFDDNFDKVAQGYWSTDYSIEIDDTYRYLIVGLATTNDGTIAPSAGSNVTIAFVPSVSFPTLAENYQYMQNITDNSEIDLEWEIGTLIPNDGGEDDTSNTRIRSKMFLVGAGTKIKLGSSNYRHLFYKYDLSKKYEADYSWTTNDILVTEDCYIRILMSKVGNLTIATSEVDSIAATEIIYRSLPQVLVDKNLNDEIVPDYFESNISAAIESSRENAFTAGIDGDSFVFITDVHWQSNQKHSPLLVKQIIDNTTVGKIICGGDLIGGGAKASMIELMSNCVDSFKSIGRFYSLLGNHDTNKLGADSPSDYFTKANAYAIMQKESDFIVDYAEPCYFFFDNATTKTRYICLDTGEEGTPLDLTQSTWLSNTLAPMPSGYHALVFAHIIYQPTDTWHIGLQPSELEMTEFMSDVCDILDEFNANNSDKVVEAIFGGHTHIDANFVTSGGIPIVLTDCDARQTFTETSSGSGVANHAVGTVNEQCFDVTSVDYTNRIIKCVRVGRGSDRTIPY